MQNRIAINILGVVVIFITLFLVYDSVCNYMRGLQATPISSGSVTASHSRPVEVDTSATLAKYEQIEVGMTYEEVVKIMGTEGTQSTYVAVEGYETAGYIWEDKELFGYLIVIFDNGKVSGKSQAGLK